MAKERVAHIDVAAGIMILFMMLGHVCASRFEFSVPHVFSYMQRVFFFFMPWFFYKSGAFYKLRNGTNIRGGKLLKPFAIWSAIGYGVYAISQLLWGNVSMCKLLFIRPLKAILFQNLVLCNEPLWFLLTLYCVINISNVVLKYLHPLILSFIGILIGYGISLIHNDYIPDILANTAMGMCFFCFGYWLKNKERNKWFVAVAVTGYLLATLLLHSPFVDMRINQCWIDRTGFDYMLWIPASICGIIVLNAFCKLAVKVYRFPVLQHIGKHAMTYFVVHYTVFYAVGYILSKVINVEDGRLLWWITLSVGAVIIMLICETIIWKQVKK